MTEVRIEWAHRWADAEWREITGNGGIAAVPVNADGTCKYEHGAEVEHVWRQAGPWQTGVPTAGAEVTAGAPQNLRALSRLLSPYAFCTGHRENCGPNCLGGGLCQVLAVAYVNVGAELEKADG